MKKILFAAGLALVLSVVAVVRQDGFSVQKIHGRLLDGEAERPSSAVIELFGQRYTYLAKGRQCFVFASEDGQTVIKFLNYSRFSSPKLLLSLPLPARWRHLLAKRERRFRETVASFQLAATHLPRETGILYLHLQKGTELPLLSIEGPAYRKTQIDLNQVAFILQKRVTPIYENLEKRWEEGRERALEEGIAAFFQFLKKRCDLGIADDDRDVEINFGFVQDEPILLDPGRLFFDPGLRTVEGREREIRVSTKRFRRWVLQMHPECIAFFDAKIEALIGKGADHPAPSPKLPTRSSM